MRLIFARTAAIGVVLCLSSLFGQRPSRLTITTAVPRLLRITGIFHAANDLPVGPTESATMSIYRDEQGGVPLWEETQNVTLDINGHYTSILGITKNDGIPLDLFSSTETLWLGIKFNRPGEVEQRREQLVSVPYALKASDAESLGGRPASAYLLAPNADGVASAGPAAGGNSGRPAVQAGTAAVKPKATTGLDTILPNATLTLGNNVYSPPLGSSYAQYQMLLYDGGSPAASYGLGIEPFNIGFNSYGGYKFYQAGTNTPLMAVGGLGSANVGIGTNNPASTLDVAGDINLSGRILWKGMTFLRTANSTPGDLALGTSALPSFTAGNTAIGTAAISSNTMGFNNTAVGASSLSANTTGDNNSAFGIAALSESTTTSFNTAIGGFALGGITTGFNNTAVGFNAGGSRFQGSLDAGYKTGHDNLAIGYFAAAYVAGGNSNNIHIGNQGVATDNGTIRLGTSGSQAAFFAAGVRGVSTGLNDAVPVLIDSNGQLGTVSSSRLFKEDIQDMGQASDGLMRLRPVTFRYRKPFADGSKPRQYGLIAEEVAEVYPDLIAHSANGQIETVKYQLLDSMLLNEVQRQEKEITALRKENQRLEDRLSRLEGAVAGVTEAKAGSERKP
jgi:hypothetical protein